MPLLRKKPALKAMQAKKAKAILVPRRKSLIRSLARAYAEREQKRLERLSQAISFRVAAVTVIGNTIQLRAQDGRGAIGTILKSKRWRVTSIDGAKMDSTDPVLLAIADAAIRIVRQTSPLIHWQVLPALKQKTGSSHRILPKYECR